MASDHIWEKLHSGNWQEVELIWRQSYTFVMMVSAVIKLLGGDSTREALELVDKGILMGAPISPVSLHELASLLALGVSKEGVATVEVSLSAEVLKFEIHTSEMVSVKEEEEKDTSHQETEEVVPEEPLPRPKIPLRLRNYKSVCQAETGADINNLASQVAPAQDCSKNTVFASKLFQRLKQKKIEARTLDSDDTSIGSSGNGGLYLQQSRGLTPIERVQCPSLEEFYYRYMKQERPVVLTGCIDHWPACSGDTAWR